MWFPRSIIFNRSRAKFVNPPRIPLSRLDCRIGLRSVSTVQPNLPVVDCMLATASPAHTGYASTMRTTRTRTTAGCFAGIPAAPFPPMMEPLGELGRFMQ